MDRCSTETLTENNKGLMIACLRCLLLSDRADYDDVACEEGEMNASYENSANQGVVILTQSHFVPQLFHTLLVISIGRSFNFPCLSNDNIQHQQESSKASSSSTSVNNKRQKRSRASSTRQSQSVTVIYPIIVPESVSFRARCSTNEVITAAFVSCLSGIDLTTNTGIDSIQSLNKCCDILGSLIEQVNKQSSLTSGDNIVSGAEVEACMLFTSQWLYELQQQSMSPRTDCTLGKSVTAEAYSRMFDKWGQRFSEGCSPIISTRPSLKECIYLQNQLDATSKGLETHFLFRFIFCLYTKYMSPSIPPL